MSEPKLPNYRETINLPVGFEDSKGEVVREAEVRAVTGADEFHIGKLHARDVRALEYAVYRLTYGADALPEEDPDTPGG